MRLKGAVCVLAVICLFGLSVQGALYSGGGTEADPYIISTAAEMNDIGNNPNDFGSYFLLTADIDLSGYTGTSFNIIGPNSTTPFTGVFDGDGHTISNFTYNSTGTEYIGLFGYVDDVNAEIKDLGLIDPNIDAGTGSKVSSLVGKLRNGTIAGCYAEGGSVSGWNLVGGLVGYHYYGTVSECYATGSVSGNNDIGGLVGGNYQGTVSNSYAMASVSGDYYYVGGLVGWNRDGTVSNSYATGSVSGYEDVGGLVGYDGFGDYTKSFWDNTVNPDVNGIGNTTDANVIGESTTNMQTASTFTDAGWDFVDESDNGVQNIWRLCNEGAEYPQLNWQFLPGDFGCPDGVEMNDLAKLIEQWLLEKLSADIAPDGGDGFVDFSDWAVFADGWQSTTDIDDLAVFVDHWLQHGASFADIAPDGGDGVVNLPDFAALAENWLAGI